MIALLIENKPNARSLVKLKICISIEMIYNPISGLSVYWKVLHKFNKQYLYVYQEITNRCHVTVLYFLLILYMFRTHSVSKTCREFTGNKVL
jgi:hypothetical protein